MSLSERLRMLREEISLSQKECATALEVEYGTYNKWENGVFPNYDKLCKIAKYFNTTTDYLLGITNVAHSQMTIDIPKDFPLTSTEDEMLQIAESFIREIGVVGVLPDGEKEKFISLIRNMVCMIRYSLSIGKTNNLMGQGIAVDRFITSSMDLMSVNSELLKQAYCKLWELNPEKRPDIKVKFSSGNKRG